MGARLRFAPSPTGNLHIGSVRTAIFNWMWAKKLNATLVLRIEDTDFTRSQKEYEDNIFEGLNWMGISFDEGPLMKAPKMKYRQSERIQDQVYDQYLSLLLASGHAYYCFETDEELEAERELAQQQGIAYKYSRKSLQYSSEEVAKKIASGCPYAIRFKVPDHQTIQMNDVIRGTIDFDSDLFSDFIIVKSDGYPTYNFAVVVDDYDMGITHVVRGEDHISNTPKQIMIYEALGWDVPCFAHLPIILGSDRSKLSKRHGAKSVSEYQADGFLPHALINYLSLLGWSPSDGRELLTLPELQQDFDVARINKAGAVFDTVKLTWMNKQYLGKLSTDEFLAVCLPYVNDHSMPDLNQKIISVRDNIDILSNVNDCLRVYQLNDEQFMDQISTLAFSESDSHVLKLALDELATVVTWDADSVSLWIDRVLASVQLGKGKVMKPIRKGTTGFESGPHLLDCLALMNREVLMHRITAVLEYVNTKTPR